MNESIVIFWFRRDLRLDDNRGLNAALEHHKNVLPIFIYDSDILGELEADDPRVSFIHQQLESMNKTLKKYNTSIKTIHGRPEEVFRELMREYHITDVYLNRDYEPYARNRDRVISEIVSEKGIKMHDFKDQVVFEQSEIVKPDGTPYTVFTPYKKKWISHFLTNPIQKSPLLNTHHFYPSDFVPLTLGEIGFSPSPVRVPDYTLDVVQAYEKQRNFPAVEGTSYLSTHLRFGTVSIRDLFSQMAVDSTFASELIWREFFMQILHHFPRVVDANFKSGYDGIQWRNDPAEFEAWCQGKTGYPIVDAGMNQLNQTGLMHNRVRMITASFLCKHLLIDWRWGEAYFASKLLDYDLSANNGNWQWVAGTGCDSAPYFRIFNPTEQQKKFDPDFEYIERWNPNWLGKVPIVDHSFARKRALETYAQGIQK